MLDIDALWDFFDWLMKECRKRRKDAAGQTSKQALKNANQKHEDQTAQADFEENLISFKLQEYRK